MDGEAIALCECFAQGATCVLDVIESGVGAGVQKESNRGMPCCNKGKACDGPKFQACVGEVVAGASVLVRKKEYVVGYVEKF